VVEERRDMSEIKNCPFCAYNEVTLVANIVDNDYYNARCVRCGACGPTTAGETPAVERWNTRRKIHPSVQVDADAYDNLRQATPEELLEAVEWSMRQSDNEPWQIQRALTFLHAGFALAQPSGWEQVAPMWLRESRKLAALDE